jgi:predicted AlkP superfamily pyrophosphatase or phosphodiesterase
VLVAVHGLVPELYRDPTGAPPAMPTLAALAQDGVSAERMLPVFPPSIYPTHTSLVTGRPPAHHGIPADRRLGRRGVRSERFSDASQVQALTLWQAASQAGRSVAALDWPATGGAAVTTLLPDVQPRRRGETWLGLLADDAAPGVLERVRRAGGAAPGADRPGAERDAVLTQVACELLNSETPPALLLLRLSQTQLVLRRFGPATPEALASFARVDGELEGLLACLQRAGSLGATAFAVAGDHGVLPVHTAVRPNAFLSQAGLIVTDAKRALLGWRAIARSNGGSAFVYAEDDEAAVQAREALQEASRSTRAFRILSADRMLRLGADPEAWFGLEAEPGYVFEDSLRTPPLGASASRASGGYLPEQPHMAAGFVAWGAGLRRGVRIPKLAQVDVAPTLARLLGLALGRVEGRVMVGLLGPAAAREAVPESGAASDGD